MNAARAARSAAYIGLGANLGDPGETIGAATDALAALPGTMLRATSRRYRTPAWGRTDQPDFINAVAVVETTLAPEALLAELLRIERRFGRDRAGESGRWGPRALDLDLLLHGEKQIDVPGLTLPHPRLHERAFVLVPLAEIAPDLAVPGRGRVAALLAAVDAAGIEAIP